MDPTSTIFGRSAQTESSALTFSESVIRAAGATSRSDGELWLTRKEQRPQPAPRRPRTLEGYQLTAVAMGLFSGPPGLHLSKHTFVGDKGDYYEITDGLPQSDRPRAFLSE